MSAWKMPRTPLSRIWLSVLLLMILLLISPTVCGETLTESEPASGDEMVLVPKQTLADARDLIDQLEYEVAVRDSQLVVREAYWQEVFAAQDQHVETLRGIIADLQGGTARDIADKVLWGFLGYGIRAATED